MTRTVEGLGRTWAWPDDDTECVKVAFGWVDDLDVAAGFCKQRRAAIQAGGNMGVWPWRLAQTFGYVVTAEPDVECCKLLLDNLLGLSNVEVWASAFMNRPDWRLRMHANPGNRGAQYVEPFSGPHPLQCITIDSLGVHDCDLIYLDVEGAELLALQGAAETIQRSHPVIAFEENGCSTRFNIPPGSTEQWLATRFGYQVVARCHNDVVMTCA